MSASEFWPGEHKVTPAAADEVDEAAVESVVGATVSESAPAVPAPSEDTEDFEEPGFDDPEEAEDDEDGATRTRRRTTSPPRRPSRCSGSPATLPAT